MSSCDTCPTKEGCGTKENCLIENNPYNQVKKVIAVMSGKGGVGKSTISVLIARTLKQQGYKVGILDADITGPSVPRLMNVKDKKVGSCDFGIIPVQSEEGIEVMSLNFLVENEESPVLWRGPIISGTVKQFWTDVFWDELDYLVIDMPPGTGDVALTVMQSIPINGMVMVTTPHEMVSMIVAKSINMAKKMEIPIIGIVENMSYIACPDCGKKIRIFEDNELDDYLKRMDLKLLGELPMNREIAGLASAGGYSGSQEVAEVMEKIVADIKNFIGIIEEEK